jgi:SAM-dependent methyltransferase
MKDIIKQIEKLYSDNLETHGIDPRSVGWNSANGQYLRFQKLLSIINEQPFTINELGCGYGELVTYMRSHNYSFNKYYGYDISEKMLEAAKDHVEDSNCEWILSDKVTVKAGFSVTSGIFNVKFNANDKEWEAYILKVLDNLFENSELGFSFNLLTTYVDYRTDHLYYGDPKFFFDHCKNNFSKKVTLLHDYELFEWTICVLK